MNEIFPCLFVVEHSLSARSLKVLDFSADIIDFSFSRALIVEVF